LGTLSIENGNREDAVVKVVEATNIGRTLRCVYIRGNSSVLLESIPEGDYRVMFTLGTDWDKEEMKFRRGARYEEFAESLSYRETREAKGIQYASYELTLHPVLEGNARTRSIGPNRFGRAVPE
jgi:hypothetical protein